MDPDRDLPRLRLASAPAGLLLSPAFENAADSKRAGRRDEEHQHLLAVDRAGKLRQDGDGGQEQTAELKHFSKGAHVRYVIARRPRWQGAASSPAICGHSSLLKSSVVALVNLAQLTAMRLEKQRLASLLRHRCPAMMQPVDFFKALIGNRPRGRYDKAGADSCSSPSCPGELAMSFWTIFFRSLRLRCPRCGGSRIFSGWFRMNEACESCGLKYGREPGFFLGSIYFNYGMTALLVVVVYFACYFGEWLSPQTLLWSLTAFSVVFPIWFFRYARSLWLGMDHWLDPQSQAVAAASKSGKPNA